MLKFQKIAFDHKRLFYFARVSDFDDFSERKFVCFVSKFSKLLLKICKSLAGTIKAK